MSKSDQELVRDTLVHKEAFAGIIERYQVPLTRYILRLGCQDTDTTNDVLQEVFIKVYTNLNSYDSGLSFNAWIYRITHNETVSFFRKQNIRPRLLTEEDRILLEGKLLVDDDIVETVDKNLTNKRIQEAISKLDTRLREVIILRFLEEKSYTEISDILRIPSGTVATYIHRGKAQLRKIFTEIDSI
jgi:RNA polymerase sigma-70 factor, ECF subfamily